MWMQQTDQSDHWLFKQSIQIQIDIIHTAINSSNHVKKEQFEFRELNIHLTKIM